MGMWLDDSFLRGWKSHGHMVVGQEPSKPHREVRLVCRHRDDDVEEARLVLLHPADHAAVGSYADCCYESAAGQLWRVLLGQGRDGGQQHWRAAAAATVEPRGHEVHLGGEGGQTSRSVAVLGAEPCSL